MEDDNEGKDNATKELVTLENPEISIEMVPDSEIKKKKKKNKGVMLKEALNYQMNNREVKNDYRFDTMLK
jgi:hypothetical protein